jgi:phosphohistidine phosphatase
MRLLIIRHAIAVPRGTPDMPDDERPLTPEGQRRFRRAARGLAAVIARPDVLLTSPLPRARRTAVLAARAWKRLKPKNEEALAGGAFADIAALLNEHRDVDIVAIVGHEPDLSGLLGRLLATSNDERLTFKKGGAALVDVPGKVEDGGTLLWYLTPRILRQLGR